MSKKPKRITYYYRGDVEHCYLRDRHQPTYRWYSGHSEQGKHGPIYPWMTKRECREEARMYGGVAIFVMEEQ